MPRFDDYDTTQQRAFLDGAASVLARLMAEAVDAPTPRSGLRKLQSLHEALEEFEQRLVAAALADGASYAQIGQDLGLSRQSAHRRFHRLVGYDARDSSGKR
jgi:DNA-directed RNA polymerase specialized sigma24 family protein